MLCAHESMHDHHFARHGLLDAVVHQHRQGVVTPVHGAGRAGRQTARMAYDRVRYHGACRGKKR